MYDPTLIDQLRDILGSEHVIADDDALQLASTGNYPTHQQVLLILRPGNTAELKSCLQLCNRHRLAVHVSSMGKNWGYGSRVPVEEGSILIELGRMNHILDFNEQLGYLTVEPGVTFRQAFEFLRERGSRLLLSITGGDMDSSMMGNALDRGIGTGWYADRFSAVCGLEVVLPDGKIIRTGFERFEGASSGKISRWGNGPYLDGLFSQSNFGIVTRMSVWLMKCPPTLQLLFYTVEDTPKLVPLLNELQDMAMEGLIRPAMTLYNDMRVLSSLLQFPFGLTQPGEWDPDRLAAYLKEHTGPGKLIGTWNGEICIRGGSGEDARIQGELIASRLKSYVKDLSTISISREEIMEELDAAYKGQGPKRELNLRNFLLGKYIGIPSNAAIRQAYWRKRMPLPEKMDPDRDGCGLVWLCPVVPFRGEDIAGAVEIIKSSARKYAFEAGISLQCLSERSVNIIASIHWDREQEKEDRDAVACYREANERLQEAGFYPYRSATLGMKAGEESDYADFLRLLKQTMDPNNILAGGKYVPLVNNE